MTTATAFNDPISIAERAHDLARALGPGWTSRDGLNDPEEDRDALLVGPDGEILRIQRLYGMAPDPAEWGHLLIEGMAPDDLPPGAIERMRVLKPTRPHTRLTPARVAYFVRRNVLSAYTAWLRTERANDTREWTATVETTREAVTTRLRRWCEENGRAYDTAFDARGGRLVLLVDGNPITVEEAEQLTATDVAAATETVQILSARDHLR